MNEERNFPNLQHAAENDPFDVPDEVFARPIAEVRQEQRLEGVPAPYKTKLERLAVELAMGLDTTEAIFERYEYDVDQAAALMDNPNFATLLAKVGAEVRDSGVSFRTKCRAISEDLLSHGYEIATDPLASASVRSGLIQWYAKMGGLEPATGKNAEDAKAGTGLTLNITFAGQAPQAVVTGHQTALIEQEI